MAKLNKQGLPIFHQWEKGNLINAVGAVAAPPHCLSLVEPPPPGRLPCVCGPPPSWPCLPIPAPPSPLPAPPALPLPKPPPPALASIAFTLSRTLPITLPSCPLPLPLSPPPLPLPAPPAPPLPLLLQPPSLLLPLLRVAK